MFLQIPEACWHVLTVLHNVREAAKSLTLLKSPATEANVQVLAHLLRDSKNWRPFVLTFGLLRVTAKCCDQPKTTVDEILDRFLELSPELLLPEAGQYSSISCFRPPGAAASYTTG